MKMKLLLVVDIIDVCRKNCNNKANNFKP